MSSTIHGASLTLESLLGPISAPASGLSTSETGAVSTGATSTLSAAFSEVEFAMLVGVSTRRVREMRKEGVIQRDASGHYAQTEVAKYCAFLRKGGTRGPESDELKAEKLRKERAAADKLELANKKARGEMLDVAEVRASWGGIVRDVRAGMLAVPARVGAQLPHLTTHDIASIDAEIRVALEGIADDDA